ncbi:hypothetical protein [Chryseobacterium arthrosphaerae]|uniref:hypothetical protein n=1 Tax=Chryseobacterium arthrosphaerae TaxID=651561 RepID=UPI00241562E6|nr:hypothetical protein [Chryseobacterium arthrosphaerae]MDG4651675.1 hypothetical protein [Chryseobacterium arthrosphaerae]
MKKKSQQQKLTNQIIMGKKQIIDLLIIQYIKYNLAYQYPSQITYKKCISSSRSGKAYTIYCQINQQNAFSY